MEYEPELGSCCIWKFDVDNPKGFNIMLPKSFRLDSISVLSFSLRSLIRGGKRT